MKVTGEQFDKLLEGSVISIRVLDSLMSSDWLPNIQVMSLKVFMAGAGWCLYYVGCITGLQPQLPSD